MANANYGQVMVAEVARIFREANVNGLLWGEHVLRAFGAPYQAQHIQFIIEDDDIENAYQALLAKGYQPCLKGRDCPLFGNQAYYPAPFDHVYVPADQDPRNGATTVSLYKKSHYIPFFPKLNVGVIQSNHPFFMLASEKRLPTPTGQSGGRYERHLQSVVMPTAQKFVEALIYLAARHAAATGRTSVWATWLGSMRYDTAGDVDAAKLPAGMQRIWERTLAGLQQYPENIIEDLVECAGALKEQGLLPSGELPLVTPRSV